jgi:aldehyde:ferredoxin oxidoreductase
MSADELRATARRIVDARKAFNIAAGWTPQEDWLPARFLDTPLADSDDATRLTPEHLRDAIRRYNLSRGWTVDGWLR